MELLHGAVAVVLKFTKGAWSKTCGPLSLFAPRSSQQWRVGGLFASAFQEQHPLVPSRNHVDVGMLTEEVASERTSATRSCGLAMLQDSLGLAVMLL